MYLTKGDQLQIGDMLWLSGEIGFDNLDNTMMFLHSIIQDTNTYGSMASVLQWFKRKFPLQVEFSHLENALFDGEGAAAKRQVVLERYIEDSYAHLESSARSLPDLQNGVEAGLYLSLYEIFDSFKLLFSRQGFCRSRLESMDNAEYICLLNLLGVSDDDVAVADPGLISVLVERKRFILRPLIGNFIKSYVKKMEIFWANLEVFAQEYRSFIKSYSYKIILLIELMKCRANSVSPGQRAHSFCNAFSRRVVHLERAEVMIFLDQMESVFSQTLTSESLRSYIELVRRNKVFVTDLLERYPSLTSVIDGLCDSMSKPDQQQLAVSDLNVVEMITYRKRS